MKSIHSIGLKWHLGFMPRGEDWRAHRQLVGYEHNASKTVRARPIVAKWTSRFLVDTLKNPEGVFDHLQRYTRLVDLLYLFTYSVCSLSMASGIALEDTYAIEVQESGIPDPFISAVKSAIQGIGTAGIFGTYMVDYIPARKLSCVVLAPQSLANEARAQSNMCPLAWRSLREMPRSGRRAVSLRIAAAPGSICSSMFFLQWTSLGPSRLTW